MHKKPSLCFVAPNIYPVLAGDRNLSIVGGAEVQQSMLGRAFVAEGYRVSTVCTNLGQPEGIEVDGIRVYRTYKPGKGLPILRFLHPHISLTWRAMKRANADVYYQRGCGHLTAIVAAFCRLHGRRFVFAGAHDYDFDPSLPLIPSSKNKWMYRWGLKQAHAVVVQNQTQAEAASHWGHHPVVIGSCYQPPAQAGVRKDGYVLWAARLCPWKRPELFMQLAARLPQFRFRMVGGPGTEPGEIAFAKEISQQAQKLKNLEYVGFVPHADIEREFNNARLFVNTSEAEGFPNTFLQAWSRGMPTVSFLEPPTGDDGRAVGCVARDIDDLVRATHTLMTNDAVWSEEGERCLKHFTKRHSLIQAYSAYVELFDSLNE